MSSAAPIPIIDISEGKRGQHDVARELVDAASEYGFVYIKSLDQGLSSAHIDKMFDISSILFKSPLEEKERCKIGKNDQGWSGMHTEKLDPKTQRVGDFKEGFNFGKFEDGGSSQLLPLAIEPYKTDITAFREACHSLCRRLLLLFGIGLGVDPPDFFTAVHSPDKPSGSILRFLYYPPLSSTSSAQNVDVRAGAHSDYGSVTLLFRLKGQAGLEILMPGNTWAPVPVCPTGTENDPSPPILVNIGDLLCYWTNGLLCSTVHRVTFAGSESGHGTHAAGLIDGETSSDPRYSIVYFCHPAEDTPLTAVPSEQVHNFQNGVAAATAENPYAERKVMTANEHLHMRLQATYSQLYQENETA